ncbi:MAG: hypothetical protein VKO21_12555 [Candidatus Sericytochromatia bacterium]|nr:hypothetical protein [Candidatus Sericytochromatia bacterium]
MAIVQALLTAVLLSGAPKPTPVPGPGLLPGTPFSVFRSQIHGLKKTGGLSSPDLRAGFVLETWQTTATTEWRVGKDLLVGDPSLRPDALVYAPRTTLVVQRGPKGDSMVVATRVGRIVTKQKEIQDVLDIERAWTQPPKSVAGGWLERLLSFVPGRKPKYPGLHVVLDNGQQRIWLGEATPSPLVTVVLEPVLYPAPAESEEEAEEEETVAEEAPGEEPTPAPTPTPQRPKKGLLEVLRFPRSHARIVLEDLATWVKLSGTRR